jgi:hypothetical protein
LGKAVRQVPKDWKSEEEDEDDLRDDDEEMTRGVNWESGRKKARKDDRTRG